MYQRASSGGSGGAQVATGSVAIQKNTNPQTIDVGFEPDILLMQTSGGTGYHTFNYYVKDTVFNPTNKFIRGFYQGNDMSGSVNIAMISQGSSQTYAQYPWIYEINGSVVTWKTNANCADSTMLWTAIKYL